MKINKKTGPKKTNDKRKMGLVKTKSKNSRINPITSTNSNFTSSKKEEEMKVRHIEKIVDQELKEHVFDTINAK